MRAKNCNKNMSNFVTVIQNKKIELMLTRRAKAYSTVPVHKLSVYLQPFRRSSFLDLSLIHI